MDTTSKKPKWPNCEKYRKAFKPTRVVGPYVGIAENRAIELGETFTEFVTEAVRQRLERDGVLPAREPG